VSPQALTKMKRLRLFINRNAHFSEGPTYLSNELRLLDWPEYPLQSFPSNFHGRKLIVFRMRNSLFKELERFKVPLLFSIFLPSSYVVHFLKADLFILFFLTEFSKLDSYGCLELSIPNKNS
jgi:hypothetical protein